MAISRIAGQMLQTNLERDGVNLSFSNLDLGNSTPVLYLDVGNNRVGINNDAPGYTLDVTGNINGGNAFLVTASASGNVTAGNVLTNTVYSSSTFTLNTASNGNILLTPDGLGFAKAVGTNGFVVPTGNTAQRPSPVDTGTIRFNTTSSQLEVWDGTKWSAASGYVSVITNQTLYGDGSTTVFALTQSVTAESILVTINGVLQTPVVDYTTSSSPDQITFTTAPAIADTIQIRYIVSTTTIASLINGSSSVVVPVSGGNVDVSVGGTSNVLVVTSTGANVNGYFTTSGNISASNLSLTGNIINPTVTGNVTASGFVGTLYTNSIVNTGANGTGNIGSATTGFNTIFAKATSAEYADLAEFYSADAEYEPGTVMVFGGDREITVSTQDADPCVAGVVSTNPSYIMNSGIFCEFPTQLALTGRVPCRVRGPVTKGAMMVSTENGYARAEKTPAMGTVIGKALENFDGDYGVIEVVIGRL